MIVRKLNITLLMKLLDSRESAMQLEIFQLSLSDKNQDLWATQKGKTLPNKYDKCH